MEPGPTPLLLQLVSPQQLEVRSTTAELVGELLDRLAAQLQVPAKHWPGLQLEFSDSAPARSCKLSEVGACEGALISVVYPKELMEEQAEAQATARGAEVAALYGRSQVMCGHSKAVVGMKMLGQGDILVSGTDGGGIKIWDVGTKHQLQSMAHGSGVSSLAMLPDQVSVASGSADGTIRIWHVQTGQVLYKLIGHSGRVTCLVVLSNSIVSSSEDNTVKLWAHHGELLYDLTGHTAAVLAVAAVGDLVVSSSQDGSTKVWDSYSGELMHSLGSELAEMKMLTGLRVAGACGSTVEVWSISSGGQLQALSGHTSAVRCLAVLPENSRLASGSEDNSVKVWDADSGGLILTLLGHVGPVNCVAVLGAGRWLASGSDDRSVIVWDCDTGDRLHVMRGHSGAVRCLVAQKDGVKLLSGSKDKSIKMWG
eukprot:TRINITY_DN38178_c0_g1_i1.p1 TRINITY_DN38178_c0_g1~~TRINITY_DN38178_c0_g1_i1.p1  ORF type:complete len:425 (+),score=90.41 TRINITY_DN38178_c0_g1_i1:3-1277(+)